MSGIFSLGTSLFNRLCFKRKFSLLATVKLLPLMFGAYWIVDQQLDTAQALSKKMDGKIQIEQLDKLELLLIKSRAQGIGTLKKSKIRPLLDFWHQSSAHYPRSQVQYRELEHLINTVSGKPNELITQVSEFIFS